MFIEAVISSTGLFLFKVFFEHVQRVRNESGAEKLKFHHNQFMIVYGRI